MDLLSDTHAHFVQVNLQGDAPARFMSQLMSQFYNLPNFIGLDCHEQCRKKDNSGVRFYWVAIAI